MQLTSMAAARCPQLPQPREGWSPNLIDADDAVCGGGVGGANNLKNAANLNDADDFVCGGAVSRAGNLYDDGAAGEGVGGSAAAG